MFNKTLYWNIDTLHQYYFYQSYYNKMNNKSLMKDYSSTKVLKNAVKNYETYVVHYNSRDLIPMSLNDFLTNYKN